MKHDEPLQILHFSLPVLNDEFVIEATPEEMTFKQWLGDSETVTVPTPAKFIEAFKEYSLRVYQEHDDLTPATHAMEQELDKLLTPFFWKEINPK